MLVTLFTDASHCMKTHVAVYAAWVEFRHESAHKGAAAPRNAVNIWCDTECRKLMRLTQEATLSIRPTRGAFPSG